jgi:hypothetical protein
MVCFTHAKIFLVRRFKGAHMGTKEHLLYVLIIKRYEVLHYCIVVILFPFLLQFRTGFCNLDISKLDFGSGQIWENYNDHSTVWHAVQ